MPLSPRARVYVQDARAWDKKAREARARFNQVMAEKTHEYMNRRHDPVDRFSAQYRAAGTTQAQAAAADDQMYTRWAQEAAAMATMEMLAEDRRQYN